MQDIHNYVTAGEFFSNGFILAGVLLVLTLLQNSLWQQHHHLVIVEAAKFRITIQVWRIILPFYMYFSFPLQNLHTRYISTGDFFSNGFVIAVVLLLTTTVQAACHQFYGFITINEGARFKVAVQVRFLSMHKAELDSP